MREEERAWRLPLRARCRGHLDMAALRRRGSSRPAIAPNAAWKCSVASAPQDFSARRRGCSVNSRNVVAHLDVRRVRGEHAVDHPIQSHPCPLFGRCRFSRAAKGALARGASRRRNRHRARSGRRSDRSRGGGRREQQLGHAPLAVRCPGVRWRALRRHLEARRASLPAGRDRPVGAAGGARRRRHDRPDRPLGPRLDRFLRRRRAPAWRSSRSRGSRTRSTSSTASTAWRRCAWS